MNKEINKEIKKSIKFKEISTYLTAGFLIAINIVIIIFLSIYRVEYFSLAIDLSKSIELGFLVLKLFLLIGILVMDLKVFSSATKQWKKSVFVKKEDKRVAEDGIKRMGIIRKAWFYWRTMEARKHMDKYNESFKKLIKAVGNIKGTETKELLKGRQEMIKGVLIWTDDFQITKIKKGRVTDEPVDEEFLNTLSISEIYEDYLIKCVDTAERFINGVTPEEKKVIIE